MTTTRGPKFAQTKLRPIDVGQVTLVALSPVALSDASNIT